MKGIKKLIWGQRKNKNLLVKSSLEEVQEDWRVEQESSW